MIYDDTIKNLETVASQFFREDVRINHAKMTTKEGEELEWFEFFEGSHCTFSSPFWPDFIDTVLDHCAAMIEVSKQFN